MIDQPLLMREAAALGVALTPEQASTLDAYCARLIETNRHLNLTAVTDPHAVLVKHLLDSLKLCALPQLTSAVADVGTGGGFPGVVLAVARPDLRCTLIDATGKKLRFVGETCAALGIPVTTLHGRAEELARGPQREQYDTVVARAVAALPVVAELCLPLVRPGGVFIAMKGPEAEAELNEAANAIALLGGRRETVEHYELPGFGSRCAILVRKISQTPAKYPRNSGAIQKKSI